MKQWLSDPIVQILSGIILVGLISLVWAIGKFKNLKSKVTGPAPSDDLPIFSSDLKGMDFSAPPVKAPVSLPPTPVVSKEVSERLDSMSQRLAEMQSVLTKQAASPSVSTPAGAVGQGFSPETIDKLLKIIGNVIQQVDILQKNVNSSIESAPAAPNPSTAPLPKL